MTADKVTGVAKVFKWRLLISSYLLLVLVISQIKDITPVWAAPSVPATARIEGMPVYAQQHYLSCEYAATRAAVARWGIQLSEEDFISAIPTNENPHLGFRGNINGSWGSINNYGIYAEPIARFLATRNLNTKLLWGGIGAIKEEVALGRPVVVWISGGLLYSTPIEAQVANQSFLLLPYEHTVTVYGYDEKGFFVADPGYGTYEYYSWQEFQRSWAYLGEMAMSVWPANQQPTQGERQGISPSFYRYWLRNGTIELLGQPIGPTFVNGNKSFQYFERARLETDNTQNSNQAVARGLLGRELSDKRQGETAFKSLSEQEINQLSLEEQGRFFPETNFVITAEFVNFWWQRGGLAAFGYPISKPFYENGWRVQYFERVRMELHPDNSGNTTTGFITQLGLLGNEVQNNYLERLVNTYLFITNK